MGEIFFNNIILNIMYNKNVSYVFHFTFRGAGQEVGRSCIVMEFKGKKIMVKSIYLVFIL